MKIDKQMLESFAEILKHQARVCEIYAEELEKAGLEISWLMTAKNTQNFEADYLLRLSKE